MAFHSKNGLMFERLADGSVKIWKDGDSSSFEVVLNQDAWASVVASVSVFGDTAHAWSEALAFHNGGQEEDDTKDYQMG